MTTKFGIFESRARTDCSLSFCINKRKEILLPSWAPSRTDDPSGDCDDISRLIPQTSSDFNMALEKAFQGSPSKFRFSALSNGRPGTFELHFFPNDGSLQDAIFCVLIDRSSEAQDSAMLQAKISALDLVGQVVRTFSETRNLSDILRIILLGVTAGPGLGFNRGFILLSNESRSHLWGCLATGPSTPEEAGLIWRDLDQRSLTLEEVLQLYKAASGRTGDAHVNRLVASLKIPLSDHSNFIVKAVDDGHSIITVPEMLGSVNSRDLISKFGTDSIAVVPLFSRESLQGVLLADNLITQKEITQSDLNVLEIFARYAADAIENSRLYGRLEQQVCRLREANEKIIQSRENLIKAEKLSSVAKMALEVAHEIRNPLTIIGGYANSHLKRLVPDDPSQKVLDIISRQAFRIENALDRFSSVVQLSEKKEGRFNLVVLVKETAAMLFEGVIADAPSIHADGEIARAEVFVDQGLFHQAMMTILRRGSQFAGNIRNLALEIARDRHRGIIYLTDTDKCRNFAEEFYRIFRNSKGDLKNQDVAVALEILQHYGGGIGLFTDDDKVTRLFVELPLCREE